MGKVAGLSGTISGKIGAFVYSKGENGVSYARAYQPQVNNPKTEGQTDQRLKMNLVGRMSAITPAGLLSGMPGVKRNRRSRFNAILLGAAVVDKSSPTSVVAKIAPEDVVFSEGSEVFAADITTPAVVTATGITLGMTLQDAGKATKYGERIIVAIIDPSDKAGYSLVVGKEVMFDDTTAKTIAVNFGTAIAEESLVCVYRSPFVLSEDGQVNRMQTLSNDGTDIVAKLVQSDGNVMNWGHSLLAVSQVFTQA